MAGIFRGLRNPQASRSMGIQRYATGGKVDYEYTPYQRYNWDYGKAPTFQEKAAPIVNPIDEVVDTTTSNDSSNGSSQIAITQPTAPAEIVAPTVQESYTDISRPNWAEPESPFVPGHEDFDWSGAGGTSYNDDYSAVIDAYDTLPETITTSDGLETNVAPEAFLPSTGTDPQVGDIVNNTLAKEIQNNNVVDSFENYGENILNNPNLTNEQIAAANPAFNQQAAINHAAQPVTITNPTTGDSYDTYAGSLTSEDFANAGVGDGTNNSTTIGDIPFVNQTLAGRILSDVNIPGTGGDTGGNYTAVLDANGNIDGSQGGFSGPGTGGDQGLTNTQYDLSGKSVAAAGVRNIGGAFAQDGDPNAPQVTTRFNPETGRSEVIEVFDAANSEALANQEASFEHPAAQPGGIVGWLNELQANNPQTAAQQQAAAWQGPGIAQTQAGAATAERGQAEGRALAAQAAAAEQQEIASNAGLSTEQLANLSPIEQLNAKYGNIDTSYAQAAANDDESHGAIRGNLTRQGLTSAEANEVLAAAKGSDDSFFATTPGATTLVGQQNTGVGSGITNALNIGSNAATTAASAQGSDIISGTGGQTRAQVQAQNLEGIDLTHESASSQRKDAADSSARQTTADEIGQAVALDPSIAELRSEDAKEYLNSVGAGNFAKEDATEALQSFIADAAEPAPAQPTSADTTYNNAMENLDAEATEAGYTSAVGKVLAEQHGWSAEQIAAAGYNRGGIVHGYADGGKISIKPSRRGIFTAKADDKGMGVQAYARKILAAPKGKYSPSLRKQANFARNAASWN